MALTKNKERRRASRAKDIQFGAEAVDLTAQAGSLPRFEAVAYSGGKLFVAGFSGPVVVDLDGLDINANASILLDHDSKKRVGHPESITVREGRILASGFISADTDHAKEVVASSKNGFRWQVSIGARVMSMKQIKAGQRAIVNGQNHEGPFVLAQRSRLNEISFVGSGGDEDNSVSIAAQSGKQVGVDKMAQKAEVKDPGSENVVETKPEAAVQAAAAPVAPVDHSAALQASRELQAQEVERAASIRAACQNHPEIHASAIREGWDPARAELEVLRKERDQPDNDVQASGAGPFIQSKKPADRNTAGQAIEASLCMQFGMDEEKAGKKFDEQVMDRALSAEYRGLGLHYLMYQTIQASGGHYRPGVMDDSTIRAFLDGERNLQASAPGTFSHLTTTGILSNVANKMLIDSFMSVKTTIPTIFGRRSVNDFKQNSSYRLSVGDELVEVPAGGEIKHAQLDEESYTNQAKTWGRMLTLTRKDIINDDLGAFEQIPRLLGRKSALKLEKEGWRTILGNAGSFFASGNSNLITGATSTLSISSLTNAEQLFMDQTDKAGDPIMLSARYLVTGTAIATVAAQLMTETRIIMESRNTSATSAKAVAASNPHAGKFDPIASPYANSQGLTNSSATKWWLFADPADVPAFVVSYLNGRDTPQIESSELDFNHLGMSWRCVFDFGVDQQDPRGAVQVDGA